MSEQSNQRPLVSCIINFFNTSECFFIEAIKSVFSQTYENWELLLVDDGSTNESTAIALRYAQQYPEKVRYLEHEGHQNLGASAARNLGIYHAKGDYIALLDSDDIWLPEKLEKQVEILEAQPKVGMVYSSTLMWYSWTNNSEDIKRDRRRHLGVKPDTLINPPTLVKLFLQGKAETPGTCSVLMRREIANNVDGFEASFRGLFDDQAFFYKICLKTPVFIESGCWDKYRQHLDSTCHVAEALGEYSVYKPNAAQLTFLTWLETYFFQEEVKDTEIWKALNKTLWPYKHKKLYDLLQPYRSISQSLERKMRQLLKPLVREVLGIPRLAK